MDGANTAPTCQDLVRRGARADLQHHHGDERSQTAGGQRGRAGEPVGQHHPGGQPPTAAAGNLSRLLERRRPRRSSHGGRLPVHHRGAAVSVSLTVLQGFVRWLDFMGLTTLVGALAFRCLIVRPPFLSRQEFDSFDRSCWSVVAVSIVPVAVTSVGGLVLRTVMMSGRALADLGVALPVVLRQTHYGAVWTARVSLIGLLLTMAWLLRTRGVQGRSWPLATSFVGATLIALTTSLSCHPPDWGED